MKPRISILLPAYDAESTLAGCLRSVLRQSERRFECIVVDDGSRDETLAVARGFAAHDERIRVLAHPHEGLVAALEAGLPHCRGELIARMDADDWMHRDRLAAQSAALGSQPELAAVGCHVRLFPRRHLSDGRRTYEGWLASMTNAEDVRRDAFVECPIAHPTLMIRRERLVSMRYRDAGWPEDYDLILRLLADRANVGIVPRRLLGWRDTPGRLSRTGAAYTLARFTDCKAHFLSRGLLAGHPEYVLWGYGSTGRTLRRALEREGHLPSRIVEMHPRRLGQRIHGAPVVPPEALREGPRHPIIVSVSGARPRGLIREALAEMGFLETRDFVCAA